MKWIVLSMLVCGSVGAATDTALDRLMQGNERFVNGQLEHPNRTTERREALVNKQKPFAVIVGCSDSRVSPEITFDQGVGDLFVVRVAGNVVSSVGLESIHFAVAHLGSKLVLVMGHENCGAVDAVLTDNTKGIPDIAKLIGPSVKGKSLEDAIKANVQAVVEELKKDPVIVQEKATVVGSYFNLATGKVELIE